MPATCSTPVDRAAPAGRSDAARALRHLIAVLERERDALSRGAADEVAMLAADKEQIAATLHGLADAARGPEGLAWHELRPDLLRVRLLNEENGTRIRLRAASIRARLSALSAADPAVAAYGPSGPSAIPFGGRMLGTA